jgi:hypothetical protein
LIPDRYGNARGQIYEENFISLFYFSFRVNLLHDGQTTLRSCHRTTSNSVSWHKAYAQRDLVPLGRFAGVKSDAEAAFALRFIAALNQMHYEAMAQVEVLGIYAIQLAFPFGQMLN